MVVVIVWFRGSSYQIMNEDHEPLEDFMRKLPDAKKHCKAMGWEVLYIQDDEGDRKTLAVSNYGGRKRNR